MRHQAEDIRSRADALVGRTDQVHWKGKGGDALRARARERAADLRRSAQLHDDAAQALENHAKEVDELKALIKEIERKMHNLINAAKDRLDDLKHAVLNGLKSVLPDPVDEWLDRFEPPPHGHKDWLDVDLRRS